MPCLLIQQVHLRCMATSILAQRPCLLIQQVGPVSCLATITHTLILTHPLTQAPTHMHSVANVNLQSSHLSSSLSIYCLYDLLWNLNELYIFVCNFCPVCPYLHTVQRSLVLVHWIFWWLGCTLNQEFGNQSSITHFHLEGRTANITHIDRLNITWTQSMDGISYGTPMRLKLRTILLSLSYMIFAKIVVRSTQ